MSKGFSLLEIVIIIVVIGILAVAMIPTYVDMTNEASAAVVQDIMGKVHSQVYSMRASWGVQSGANGNVWLFVNGIEMRFDDGWVFRTRNGAHVPASVPASIRNRRSTRLWYALLSGEDLIVAGTGTGFNPLTNAQCPGNNRVSCWNYEINGVPFQQVRYNANTGSVDIFPP